MVIHTALTQMTQIMNCLKHSVYQVLLLGILLCLGACGASNNANTEQEDSLPEVDTKVVLADSTPQPQNHQPGEIPFDFPMVNTSAKAREFVLAPMLQWIEDGFKKGNEQMVLIFHSREMIQPGNVTSRLKAIGTEVTIPNSMIIPIPAGQRANKGEIILTWEQNRGTSMRTAIVVEASNPTSPKIQYLDTPFQQDTQTDQAKPNTFVVLSSRWQPGTYLAVKEGVGYDYAQVIRVADEKVLTIGFTGKIKVYPKKDCKPIPIKLAVKPGEKVQVVKVATFREGVVKKVIPEIGRVFVEIDFGGKPEIVVAGYGKVTKGLEVK